MRGRGDEGKNTSVAANGGLTHGAPVDGLGLVFVLGSVPHERQPFNSCQSAARDRQTNGQTDRGERDDRTSPREVQEGKEKEKKEGRTEGCG